MCPIEDDFTNILNKIIEANIIVVGTPVYFGGVSSVLKLFIDRLQILYNNMGLIKIKKCLLFISIAAENRQEVFASSILELSYVKYVFKIIAEKFILINGHYNTSLVDELLKNYDLIKILDDLIENEYLPIYDS